MRKHKFGFPQTVTVLAKEVGLDRKYLSMALNGHFVPKPDIAKKIEIATKGVIKASTLLGLDDLPTLYKPIRKRRGQKGGD